GLLINFAIIGTEVGNQALTPSLSATLGDIDPASAKQVVWDMTSTLQGKFIEFDASFTHVNDLGRTNTSLINSVQIHELTHKVLANRIAQYDSGAAVIDDDVPDFLVNDVPDPGNLPDVLYVSDGSTAGVNVRTNATVDSPAAAGHLQVHVSINTSNGWNYVQIPDPGAGFLLASVVRSDGKPIALNYDAWTTDRTFPASSPGAVREHLLHLFDWTSAASTVSYTVTYRSTNTTIPTIVQFGPVTPFVQPGAVSSVNVTFSEKIDLSTFDYRSLTLTRNGGANLINAGSGISIALVSGTNYSINGLSTLTTPDGNYQLTMNGALIYDVWGNNVGNTSSSVQWTKGNAPLVVQAIASISPNPRKAPVANLNVTFSRSINSATFDYRALSLTVNGGPNRISPDVTVALVSGSTYAINGLNALTGDEGTYVLTVNAAAVQDASSNAGSGTKSVTWTNLLTGPRIVALQQLATNPRNIVVQSLDVTFSQPIDPTTFDYHAVTLTRDGGPNLITSEVTVSPVNSTTYRIANINWVQGSAGTYSFTVNATGAHDLAGNPGAGSTNETWQIILQAPPSPTQLAIAPDFGSSATDGLTSTNSIVLSGKVGTTNLTVRVYDMTSSQDFGTAAVNGTNFTLPLAFTAEGQHHLKAYSVDIAGNVSAPTFLDAFIDLVAPSAVMQSVSPNPTYMPVTNLLVTFSKAINTNTIQATNFTLTRNGTNAGSPTFAMTSSSTLLVTGLAPLTSTPGSYQLTLNLVGIQDLAGNVGKTSASTTWQTVPANQAPIITQESNGSAQPGTLFQRQITATDSELNKITFTLAAGAPVGATITTNGLFTWTPTCDQGSTTNVVTVVAADNGTPIASSTMSFTVSVSDCLQIQVGSGVAQVGHQGTVPVTVFASSGVTNLSFVLSYPSNRLGSWTISTSNNAVATSAVVPVNPSNTMFRVSTGNGQSLQGTALLGNLSFVPSAGPSAFVPLTVLNSAAIKSGNNWVNSIQSGAGRIAVIGAEPLLDAQRGAGTPQLVLYGNPGTNYQIAFTTNLGGTWLPGWTVGMTNLFQPYTLTPTPSQPQTFYRAWQY
ncbi:MAG: hypothetical protein JWO95_172, partial [Verrucomicrobiales bacterium]|nr:hypothetical protein [Verrucomicrobiales bacterium]